MRFILILFTILLTLYWMMGEMTHYNEQGFTYNVGLGFVLTILYMIIYATRKDKAE